jgi:hypothetical protein
MSFSRFFPTIAIELAQNILTQLSCHPHYAATSPVRRRGVLQNRAMLPKLPLQTSPI